MRCKCATKDWHDAAGSPLLAWPPGVTLSLLLRDAEPALRPARSRRAARWWTFSFRCCRTRTRRTCSACCARCVCIDFPHAPITGCSLFVTTNVMPDKAQVRHELGASGTLMALMQRAAQQRPAAMLALMRLEGHSSMLPTVAAGVDRCAEGRAAAGGTPSGRARREGRAGALPRRGRVAGGAPPADARRQPGAHRAGDSCHPVPGSRISAVSQDGGT